MISLTSLPSLSDPPPVNAPATIASSRTWASAFVGTGRATDAPQGTLCFSASLASKLLVTASGTRAAAKDDKVMHVLRLLPCPREELEEWERLMRGFPERQRRREEAKRKKEEKERKEKEEK